MSDLVNEQLSAFLDGELPPEETALLLRRLEREPELAGRLERYRRYGDCLRGQGNADSHDLIQRIHAQVALEPEWRSVRSASALLAGWRRTLGGLGVAAGVAALSVWLVQHGAEISSQPMASSQVVPAATSLGRDTPSRTTLARAPAALTANNRDAGLSKEPVSYVTPAAHSSLQTIPEAELARYVVAHSEVSTPLSARDVLIHLVADAPSQDSQ
jgi:negative regulator of sigma E activity